ncbi:uncharacterized protein P174DRAFT_289442 [Aspergillus novofumigatus IBT 16806]|uniref:Translocation protein SEC62 n=1 Tax=Aspergillus novofumigatus (strain IBT 16806) TaxID=1392255 RepID=A0A2I1BXN1_ASPN1|nr:uncharacterized protein P174DRAFT_289442 [Aspergillus novofumigatus IBT 16806]PKX90127.1 hypothetical protein P174DRAFT_289442 [Aspergillus novofumigatus IBT 16806]
MELRLRYLICAIFRLQIIMFATFIICLILRVTLFCLTRFIIPPGVWLFPNLFADCGFFASFSPLWTWNKQVRHQGKARLDVSITSCRSHFTSSDLIAYLLCLTIVLLAFISDYVITTNQNTDLSTFGWVKLAFSQMYQYLSYGYFAIDGQQLDVSTMEWITSICERMCRWRTLSTFDFINLGLDLFIRRPIRVG